MLRERVANNVFVFTSELYAQVTAGAIITSAGAIVIDTLAFPSESRQIAQFIEERQGVPVRYVVNTHYHADHTYGASLFENAKVIAHRNCRDLLDTKGRAGLEKVQRGSREMSSVKLRLPDIVFDMGILNLHLGGVTLQLRHSPGHSPDSVVCLVEDERILFAADTLMPIPFFADGSWEDFVQTLETLLPESFENVVQGHGEVILRGEVQEKIKEDLHYLQTLRNQVENLVENGQGVEALSRIDIEACGKSRIPLNGLVQQLHRSNVESLYKELIEKREGASQP
jgi:cyclase